MIFGSLSKFCKCCLHHSMISDSSFMIIPVISLQAVTYGLHSFLTSFTNWYILPPYFFYPCSFFYLFHLFFKVCLLFLSMDFFLCFFHFFISFLWPSSHASVSFHYNLFVCVCVCVWLQNIHQTSKNGCWQKMCSDLLVSNFKGFEKTSCSCYRRRWSTYEATGLEKSAWEDVDEQNVSQSQPLSRAELASNNRLAREWVMYSN